MDFRIAASIEAAASPGRYTIHFKDGTTADFADFIDHPDQEHYPGTQVADLLDNNGNATNDGPLVTDALRAMLAALEG